MVVAVTLLVGCSGSSDESATLQPNEDLSFCEQAEAFQVFQADAATDLSFPERAPAFIEVSIQQLGVLRAATGDSDVQADIDGMVEGFERLDDVMAELDYDLTTLLFDGYSDGEANAAAQRLDGYLQTECGLRGGEIDTGQPLPFDPNELDVFDDGEGSLDDDDLVDELVAALGLGEEEASCLVAALGDDAVPLFTGADPIDDDTAALFATAVIDCDIDPEGLG